MYSDRKVYELQDIAELKGGFAFKSEDYTDEGMFVLRTVNITESGRIARNGATFISDKKAKEYERFALEHHDTLFVMVGATLGKIGLVKDTDLPALLNQNMWVIRADELKVNPLYLHYAFSEESKKMLGWASGAARDFVRRDDYRKLKIYLPSRSIQDQVADFIGAVDDKIDLNRQINQTLETMAQAIFKSWFVDFDPVKAKIAAIEAGQDPLRAAMSAISGKTDAELDAMPRPQYEELAATAALFPEELVESELGDTPKGWSIAQIRDVAEVIKGKSYSSKDLVDNDEVALVTLKSFERGGGFRMDGFKPYVGSYKPNQVVSAGDLIIAYTDVTQAAELIGKPAIVVGVDRYKKLVASLDVGVIRPLNERSSRQFLYGLFMMDAFQSHTFSYTSGTTVLHLAKEGVPCYKFACPSAKLVSTYSDFAEKIAKQKQVLLDKNLSLTLLRDTLLPKLLSGELSVAELEEAV